MTRGEIREQARTEYGLEGEVSDAFFTDAVMDGLINRAHRWLARRTRCYRGEKTVNLPAGSGGLSAVNLGSTEFEVDTRPSLVRALAGSTWRALRYLSEEELRDAKGPLEDASAGDPLYYFLRTGEVDGQHRQLCVYPGVASEVTNGLKYAAFTLPADIATGSGNDGTSPALPDGEDAHLIPVVQWLMAGMERNRNRPDAPVEYYLALAEREAQQLRHNIEKFRRGGPRRVISRYA